MGGFGVLDVTRWLDVGTNTGTTTNTNVTAGTPAHTKGSYAQIVASTSFDASGVLICVGFGNSVASFLVDVAVGAAASEQIIANDLFASVLAANLSYDRFYLLPVSIPSSTRVAMRAQSSVAGALIRCAAYLIGGGFAGFIPLGRVTTYGASGANSNGTVLDPGGVANTKGSWGQLVASSANPIRVLALATDERQDTTRAGETQWYLDLGVGAAGSEQVVLPNIHCHAAVNALQTGPYTLPFLPCTIPAGTRIAARVQSDNTNATDRLIGLIAYGVD